MNYSIRKVDRAGRMANRIFPGVLNTKIFFYYRDDSGNLRNYDPALDRGVKRILTNLQLHPTDDQVEVLRASFEWLRRSSFGARLIIKADGLKKGVQFVYEPDTWPRVSQEPAAAIIRLEQEFMGRILKFLSRYLAKGEIWPNYEQLGIKNVSDSEEFSTSFSIYVQKAAPIRQGNLLSMFDLKTDLPN